MKALFAQFISQVNNGGTFRTIARTCKGHKDNGFIVEKIIIRMRDKIGCGNCIRMGSQIPVIATLK